MKTKYECGNCGPIKRIAKELIYVEGLNQRLDPGDTVPAGECECGALAYVVEPDKPTRVILGIEGGNLQSIVSTRDLQVHRVDWDNIQAGDKLTTTFEAPDRVVTEKEFTKELRSLIRKAKAKI